MGVNKVILIGNLGHDPELRYTASQTPVCQINIATGERRKDQSGNWVEHTEWHRVVTFGRTAENVSNYLKKGSQAYIEGRIQTRKWTDKEGNERYSTEVVANTVQFLGGGGGGGRGRDSSPVHDYGDAPEAQSGNESVDTSAAMEVGFEDDDIPF